MKRLKNIDTERKNGLCIMMEGLFNALGNDIMGMTTIVPLFLTYIGASLKLIGSITTIQSVMSATLPLALGWMMAGAKSKRNISILLNGIGRAGMLLIPLGVFLNLSFKAELILFFCVIIVHYFASPLTGITWSYLLGVCVPDERRGRLLGRLYAISGMITFASSAFIKFIRAQEGIPEYTQYAIIFSLGGLLMATSVLFYLPLKEPKEINTEKTQPTPRMYLKHILVCFKDGCFRRLLYASAFSQLTSNISAFFFVFAQTVLGLSADRVSNLIIFQTLGLMIGGFVTGEIANKFGTRKMLISVRVLEILLPVLSLLSISSPYAYPLSIAAVFIIGVTKGGAMGYQSFMLETVPKETSVYYIVSKSLALLPISFSSVLTGTLIEKYTNTPVFWLQLVLTVLSAIAAVMLVNRRKTDA